MYANANWELNEYNRLVFSTSYNPNTSQFGLVNLTFRYQPDTERNIKLDAVYDPVNDIWSTLDLETRFRQKLAGNLEGQLRSTLQLLWGRLRAGQDWHGLRLALPAVFTSRYNFIDREYSFQIWYKVLPEAGFAFGSGRPVLPGQWQLGECGMRYFKETPETT